MFSHPQPPEGTREINSRTLFVSLMTYGEDKAAKGAGIFRAKRY